MRAIGGVEVVELRAGSLKNVVDLLVAGASLLSE
jgi:hypothetical protein